MKRFTLVSALILAAALPVLAQNGPPYRFDNFDFADGVRVQLPAAPARRSRKDARGRKLVVSSNLSYSHSNTPLNQLTSMKLSESLDGFTTGNSDVDNLIVESGKRNAVDPILLYSIMHQESTFKQKAVSPKGARGLMQLMPGTAVRFGVTNIFDPRQNIEGGARYVRFLLDQFDGDITLALAGYNGGPFRIKRLWHQSGSGEVDRFLEGLDIEESKTYVKRILVLSDSYRQLYPTAG